MIDTQPPSQASADPVEPSSFVLHTQEGAALITSFAIGRDRAPIEAAAAARFRELVDRHATPAMLAALPAVADGGHDVVPARAEIERHVADLILPKILADHEAVSKEAWRRLAEVAGAILDEVAILELTSWSISADGIKEHVAAAVGPSDLQPASKVSLLKLLRTTFGELP